MNGTLPMEEIEMFLNKYDKPATMADRNTRHVTMKNPLDGLKYSGNVSADALKSLRLCSRLFALLMPERIKDRTALIRVFSLR